MKYGVVLLILVATYCCPSSCQQQPYHHCHDPTVSYSSKFKIEGDSNFQQKKYLKAAVSYTRALEQSRHNNLTIRSNRVMALMKAGLFSKALQDCDIILHDHPDHFKTLYRKGSMLKAVADVNLDKEREGKDLMTKAYQALKKALSMCPSSFEVGKLLQDVHDALVPPKHMQGFLVSNEGTLSNSNLEVVARENATTNTLSASAASLENRSNDDNNLSSYSPMSSSKRTTTSKRTGVNDKTTMPSRPQQPPLSSLPSLRHESNLPEYLHRMILTAARLLRTNGTNITPQYWMFHPQDSTGPLKECDFSTVQIPDAFRSAETVSQCSRTLADVVRRRGVVAACTVVPRSQIHFPTSWQDASNNINFDGIVFQVEQRYGKRVIFLPHLPPGTTLFNNTEEMANGQEEGQQEEITDALEMDEEEYALHSVWDLL